MWYGIEYLQCLTIIRTEKPIRKLLFSCIAINLLSEMWVFQSKYYYAIILW